VVTTELTTCTTYDGVKCWGSGVNGRLGTGSTSNQNSPPTDPIDLGSDFVAFKTSCALNHCCSLSTAHSVKCWGGWQGAGYSNGNNIDSPSELGDALPEHWSGGIHDIIALKDISCVLEYPGDVYCFGYYHYFFDLFTSWSGYKSASQAVKQNVGFEVDSLGGGYQTLCVAKANGRVTCKGPQFRSLSVTNKNVGGAVESVACGDRHCCALSTSKELTCWSGSSLTGPLPANHGLNVQDVGVGSSSTCIVSTGGEVKCYGLNQFNQLGGGSSTFWTSNTFQISSDFAPYNVAISSGGKANHFCVYDKWRPLMQCWGDNRYGQLGHGNTGIIDSRPYSRTMPMVAVGALCAPYLTGFHYSSYNGEWTEVPGVTKKKAPVYQRQTSYGTKYLWKYRNQRWGIGNDYTKKRFAMIRRHGPNLFDPCEGSTELNGHYACYNWMYVKNGKWTITPERSEQISCFNVDAAASMAGSEFTEDGEMEELLAPPPDESEAGPGDFIPMLAGAAVGALLVAVIVTVVVTVRKKMAAKSTELEMTEAVHVPDVSAMSGVDAVTEDSAHARAVTVSVSMDTAETMMNAEIDKEKETETEVEVVTATEMEAGSRNEC